MFVKHNHIICHFFKLVDVDLISNPSNELGEKSIDLVLDQNLKFSCQIFDCNTIAKLSTKQFVRGKLLTPSSFLKHRYSHKQKFKKTWRQHLCKGLTNPF